MNQPPQTEKQTDKRIVSKGEYVKAQGKRVGIGLLGGCLLIAMVPIIAFLFFCFFAPVSSSKEMVSVTLTILMLVFAIYLGSRMGIKSLRSAIAMPSVVPLTRANSVDLPAPESLVRASEEPIQQQKAVLLRAATQEPETPPEQLVRPVGGGKQI